MRPSAQRSNEDGTVATEYLFLVVLVAIVLAVGVGLFGDTLRAGFDDAQISVTDEVDTS